MFSGILISITYISGLKIAIPHNWFILLSKQCWKLGTFERNIFVFKQPSFLNLVEFYKCLFRPEKSFFDAVPEEEQAIQFSVVGATFLVSVSSVFAVANKLSWKLSHFTKNNGLAFTNCYNKIVLMKLNLVANYCQLRDVRPHLLLRSCQSHQPGHITNFYRVGHGFSQLG